MGSARYGEDDLYEPLARALIVGTDPDARLEPNPDWKIRWGRDSTITGNGWMTPNRHDHADIRLRLRTGRRQYGRPSICQVVVVTNPHQKSYWFVITRAGSGMNGIYHHGPNSSKFEKSLESADFFRRFRDAPSNWAFLVLANNRTQVKRWAARLAAPKEKEPKMDGYVLSGTESEILRAQADREMSRAADRALELQRRADYLDSLPVEPVVADGEPNVVYFEKQFDVGGTVYHYAAIQVDDYWYTSGPVEGCSPRSWQNLVQWIYTFRSGRPRGGVVIWSATEYTPL